MVRSFRGVNAVRLLSKGLKKYTLDKVMQMVTIKEVICF
jgi:hypothetical protein